MTTVTDNEGAFVKEVFEVSAEPHGAAAVYEGDEYMLTLGDVVYPNQGVTVSEYAVHWGDGQTDTYPSAVRTLNRSP